MGGLHEVINHVSIRASSLGGPVCGGVRPIIRERRQLPARVSFSHQGRFKAESWIEKLWEMVVQPAYGVPLLPPGTGAAPGRKSLHFIPGLANFSGS